MKKPNAQESKTRCMTLAQASLALNGLLLGGIVAVAVVYSSGAADMAIVNKGISLYCNKDLFSNQPQTATGLSSAQRLAWRDYTCGSNESAAKFYADGLNGYLKSRNLPQLQSSN